MTYNFNEDRISTTILPSLFPHGHIQPPSRRFWIHTRLSIPRHDEESERDRGREIKFAFMFNEMRKKHTPTHSAMLKKKGKNKCRVPTIAISYSFPLISGYIRGCAPTTGGDTTTTEQRCRDPLEICPRDFGLLLTPLCLFWGCWNSVGCISWIQLASGITFSTHGWSIWMGHVHCHKFR